MTMFNLLPPGHPLITGYFAACTCPAIWHSVLPPPCMVHNRSASTTVTWIDASELRWRRPKIRRGKRAKNVRRVAP